MVNSAIARGIVTALGWLVGGYRAFNMNEFDKAFEFMQVTGVTRSKTLRAVEEMRQGLELGASAGKAATNR